LVRKKVHAGFNVRPQNDNSFVLYYWERRQQAIKIRKRDTRPVRFTDVQGQG
jgi:hypothetical protein